MSAGFAWREDDPVAGFAPHAAIDAVTAWRLLQAGGVAGATGDPDETFFSLIDDADPGAVVFRAATTAGTPPVAQRAAVDALLAEMRGAAGMARPRLFVLPLPRAAVDPATLAASARLGGPAATRPGQLLPRLAGRKPLPGGGAADPGPQVIVGIVDYGINIAHRRFLHALPDGRLQSRVAHAWVMDGAFARGGAEDGAEDEAVARVPFGHEVDAAGITAALARAGGDEATALRELGLLGFSARAQTALARRASHGTHVLDLAAGMEPADARGAALRIIAALLPETVGHDSSGGLLGPFFLHALAYVLQRARDLGGGRAIPVLVNASLGFSGGPRGGGHLVERSIDALVAAHRRQGGGPVQVVLPAGNGNLARGHASAPPRPGGTRLRVPWRLQPCDRTPNHLEAWVLREGGGAVRLEVALTPPGAAAPLRLSDLGPGMARLLVRTGADRAMPVGRIALTEAAGRLQLTLSLAPTDPGPQGGPAAPAGAWMLEIAASAPDGDMPGSAAPIGIDAWILRDDDPLGQSQTARQSYFDDPAFALRNTRGALRERDPADGRAAVRRAGSLNAIATGAEPGAERVVVGGCIMPNTPLPDIALPETAPPATQALRAAPYSGTPMPPDSLLACAEAVSLAAPCETSVALPGILAAGSRSGSRVALAGTSIAVPQVVAAMAANLLNGRPATAEALALRPDGAGDPRLGLGVLAVAPARCHRRG